MPEVLLVSVLEASRILGIGRTAAYRLIRSGQLPSRVLGTRRLILVNDLERFAEALPIAPGPSCEDRADQDSPRRVLANIEDVSNRGRPEVQRIEPIR